MGAGLRVAWLGGAGAEAAAGSTAAMCCCCCCEGSCEVTEGSGSLLFPSSSDAELLLSLSSVGRGALILAVVILLTGERTGA